MAVDEQLLRRAFVDYEEIPEPPKFPPKYDESPGPPNEDVARNAQVFPDLYLTIRARAEQAVSSAWDWVTLFRGGPVVPTPDPSRSRSAT